MQAESSQTVGKNYKETKTEEVYSVFEGNFNVLPWKILLVSKVNMKTQNLLDLFPGRR